MDLEASEKIGMNTTTFASYAGEIDAFANQSGMAESLTQDGKTTSLTAVLVSARLISFPTGKWMAWFQDVKEDAEDDVWGRILKSPSYPIAKASNKCVICQALFQTTI